MRERTPAEASAAVAGAPVRFAADTRRWGPRTRSYPGESIISFDTPAILGTTLFVAMVYVFLTLAVDLLQAALDPRIRLR